MRHSSLSFVFSGLICASLGACLASGTADGVHGGDFGDDASSGADAPPAVDVGQPQGQDAGQQEAAAPIDTGVGYDSGAGSDSGGDAGYDAPPVDSGNCNDTTALVAGSATTLFRGLQKGRGAWALSSAATPVLNPPALVWTGGSGFLAAVRSTNNALEWTATSGGAWSGVTSLSGTASTAAPALAAIGATVHLVYLGTDGKYYHGTYSGSSWDPASDRVGGSTAQSFGPTAVSMAAIGSGLLFSHRGGTSDQLYAEGWAGGSWSANPVATAKVALVPTATTALVGGAADSLIGYITTDMHISYATRTGTTWTSPAKISDTLFTNDRVSVAPLPGGKALLVFRGTDNKGYATLFDGSAWSVPAAGPLVSGDVAGPPSAAPGACGDDAVAAFPMASGDVQMVRLAGGLWTAPVAVNGTSGATTVAVATGN